ncbi:hypothetical protein [Chitinivorax sp. B]|uniref:hypothetical protein n=1 Tax=Chitinivorax sp. B TaxID=2502235 RepID=UPI0010F8404B|nr:hypothetical protein [Chitinivorax sp. B]
MAGSFQCTHALAHEDGRSVIMTGKVTAGLLSTGMLLQIILDSGFAIQLPISATQGNESLVVDCDDAEGVEMVLDLAAGGEQFQLVKED